MRYILTLLYVCFVIDTYRLRTTVELYFLFKTDLYSRLDFHSGKFRCLEWHFWWRGAGLHLIELLNWKVAFPKPNGGGLHQIRMSRKWVSPLLSLFFLILQIYKSIAYHYIKNKLYVTIVLLPRPLCFSDRLRLAALGTLTWSISKLFVV